MAVLHQATLTPTKLELVTAHLDSVPWGGSGDVTMIGGYRFDDPAGHVGIEALLASRGDSVFHIPLTYRDAPLDGADDALITTMTHSVLGERWVYDAAADPVAVDCYTRALHGEVGQASLEVHRADGSVVAMDPPILVRLEGSADRGSVVFTHDLADPVSGDARLVAGWPDGFGVIAALN
ncbi:hypothetical protein nbrc107696_39580 [Gordonia spumicola]|uniref:Maltokinase N-terminal cap domain-containing protein n=1 Tax=Gordonia spumicola TaxID=589161 RepID=A0A7I9VE73_9ACTN|nr:hypothetical protein [Gordonia spumicola]GEE03512.1 hypothetical protein nbrc107696_39580 [Gordonia spumicola]